jgi:hypothetical protein
MAFEILDTLSLPGDPAKPNEDAFLAESFAAVVLDGATMVSDPLLPGKSDAAWIAQFGARRLISHLREGDAPRAAVRHALADAERSFAGLRRRAPLEPYENPCASMVLAVPFDGGLDVLWYGDCSALVLRPGQACEVIGIAFDRKASESGDAARLSREKNMAPVGALARAEFLPFFQDARNKVNVPGGTWLFAPQPAASEHVARMRLTAPDGTLVLLCSDGFLTLAGDYAVYDPHGLVEAAGAQGLKALGGELRAIEDADPEGRRFARFKKSDDATAVLLKLA